MNKSTKNSKALSGAGRATYSQQGFALVLTLVVLTVLFAAGAGLALNRQMWSFMAQKQLDNSLVDAATRSDMRNWFGGQDGLRDVFQDKGVLDLDTDPVMMENTLPISRFEFSVAAATNTVLILDPADAGDAEFSTQLRPNEEALFQPRMEGGVMMYPEYDASVGSIAMPTLFNVGALTNAAATNYPDESVIGEPFWGTASYKGSFGVVFNREMSEDERQMREGRTEDATTKLRAWNSIDAGRRGTVHVRVLPISTFTLFSPYPGVDINDATIPAPTIIDPTWINPISVGLTNPTAQALQWAGSANWGTTNIGMGRIYVEGQLSSDSEVTVGLPIVATGGFQGGGSNMYNLTFPSYMPGPLKDATISTNLSASNFWRTKMTTTHSMLVSSDESPARLLRPGVSIDPDTGRWVVGGADPAQSLGDVAESPGKELLTNSQVQIVWDYEDPVYGFFNAYDQAINNTNVGVWDTMVTQMYSNGLPANPTIPYIKFYGLDMSGWDFDHVRYVLSRVHWSPASFSNPTNSTDVWAGVRFEPEPEFYDDFPAGQAPKSFYVGVRSTNTRTPFVGLRVERVSSLTTSTNRNTHKFTFVSLENDLLLDRSVNRDNDDTGTMIVAPKIFVSPPNNDTNAPPVGIGGVVITEAYDPRSPFYLGPFINPANWSKPVQLEGSLVLWKRLQTPVAPAGQPPYPLGVSLTPDPEYISGEKIPNLVPAVLDVRMTSDGLKTYGMKAVMKDADGNVITNTPSPAP